jgi:two-component system chemotaxis sensor kinase CheA
VVERAVEEAGGEVRVRTERGRGTSFELRLPTTLALLPSLVIRSSGHAYCVDAARVVETGQAGPSEITREGARHTLRWRGRELPLVALRELLGQPGDDLFARRTRELSGQAAVEDGAGVEGEAGDADGGTRLAFFVARAGGRRGRLAVVCDSVGEETQALVRGLGRHATRWRGVGGASELADGTVALVLDLPRLLEDIAAGA